MPIGGPMTIWCDPMRRGDLKLASGDIADALAWFKETTGKDARLIVLNAKNERFAKEAGDGVKVEYLGGCLRWEVWLSAESKVKSDIITDSDGFVCRACLMDKLTTEASPDPRYCQGCYGSLLKEAEMDTGRRGGDWRPVKATKKTAQVSQDVRGIMSTLERKKFEVDIIPPPVATRASRKRGPKHRALPEDLIKRFAGEGMGSKGIAGRLKVELGITVSYKTIQRVLSGERKQPALPISET